MTYSVAEIAEIRNSKLETNSKDQIQNMIKLTRESPDKKVDLLLTQKGPSLDILIFDLFRISPRRFGVDIRIFKLMPFSLILKYVPYL